MYVYSFYALSNPVSVTRLYISKHPVFASIVSYLHSQVLCLLPWCDWQAWQTKGLIKWSQSTSCHHWKHLAIIYTTSICMYIRLRSEFLMMLGLHRKPFHTALPSETLPACGVCMERPQQCRYIQGLLVNAQHLECRNRDNVLLLRIHIYHKFVCVTHIHRHCNWWIAPTRPDLRDVSNRWPMPVRLTLSEF